MEKIGEFVTSKIIGHKPVKPATYDLRKSLISSNQHRAEDLDVCGDYEKRLAEWEDESRKIKEQRLRELESLPKIEKQTYKITPTQMYADFVKFYKAVNKKDFSPVNPYSDTNEPKEFVYTLIYYFLQDDSFFNSPLLRKDVSIPSFDKGLLVVGGYGCGKSSTFRALFALFRNYSVQIKRIDPKNKKELLQKFRMVECVSTDVVIAYNSSKTPSSVISPLITINPLYIDDILREEDASNFGKHNIFKTVLTHRGDFNKKMLLSLNPVIGKDGEHKSFEDSLKEFELRYDGRVYDRLFGGLNMVEMNGKSMRR